MTVWYMDYENGTDANAGVGAGDSFATRRKRIDNFVAIALNPGDEVRIMGSPNPTLLGNATWTDGPLQSTRSIASSTNATPIVVTASAHGLVTGDTVIVNGHTTNTNANGVWTVTVLTSSTYELRNPDGTASVGNGVGSGGTMRKVTSLVVTLPTEVTQNIAVFGGRGSQANWTASANVTCSKITTDTKEGGECQSVAIGAAFTTGLAAYFPTGTLNLSGYQQVSFWIKQTSGTIGAAGATRLRLCTDTAGAVPVHDIPVPALGSLNQWFPVVVDLGVNLNSAIQSVSFDVVTDNAAQTFLLSNIVACKAKSDPLSLNLTSLIGKDPGDHSYGDGYECWWGIQSINGTRVILDGTINNIPTSSPQRGYAGTTETVATYKRETIKTIAAATSSTQVQNLQDSGVSGNLIYFSGGWDRTNMSTQTGETWFDGQNGFGVGVYTLVKSFVHIDKINFTRYDHGYFASSSNDMYIGRCEVCNISGSTSATCLSSSGLRLNATTISAVACGAHISTGTAAVVQTIGRADSISRSGVITGISSFIGTVKSASNNLFSGVENGIAAYIGNIEKANGNVANGCILGNYSKVGNIVSLNNNNYGVNVAASVDCYIYGGSVGGNINGGVGVSTGNVKLRNFTINEATEVALSSAYGEGCAFSENHDNTQGYHVIFTDGGRIETDSTITNGTSAYSWKFMPTSSNRNINYPLSLKIAQIAVAANSLVTVKAWFRRSNTSLTGRLLCKGKQLSGVDNDVFTNMTAAINTWEEVTITFTPTEAGVIEIEAQFYGGTTYSGWVSGKLTVEQS